jgi:hypothetical protein
MELDIPTLDSWRQVEKFAAKPGCALHSSRSALLPSHLPLNVRWTRYGAWTDDGSTVLGEHGHPIYEANKVHFTRRGPDSAPARRSLVWRG